MAAVFAFGCGPVSASDVLTQQEPVDPQTGGAGGGSSISASSGWPSSAGAGGAASPGKPSPTQGDAGSAGAGAASDGSAGSPPVWDPPPPPLDPGLSKDAKSFCKKFEKFCGFESKTYEDAFACKALYDSYPKKKKKCVEGALQDAKADPSKKNCRAAGGGAYCA